MNHGSNHPEWLLNLRICHHYKNLAFLKHCSDKNKCMSFLWKINSHFFGYNKPQVRSKTGFCWPGLSQVSVSHIKCTEIWVTLKATLTVSASSNQFNVSGGRPSALPGLTGPVCFSHDLKPLPTSKLPSGCQWVQKSQIPSFVYYPWSF